MVDELFVGFSVPDAIEVKIPIFFMLIAGQTQLSGKTTLLKALARQAAEHEYKILILDTKTQIQDYESFGTQVPICLQESTDSLVLITLLESIFRRKITAYYATLTRISEDAETFEDVIRNAEALEQKTKTGFIKDACRALVDLLKRLKTQTEKVETTPELQLPYDINRMTINDFDLQSQQLIVKSVVEQALRKYKKLIIILDESYKFLPQRYSSACTKAIQEYVTQGGATECYLWMSTQFLAPTSKDAMKAMAVKLLGTQDHDTECEHTLDLIPGIKVRKWNNDTVMKLKLGHFICVTKKWVKLVYVVPEYADKNECRQVARGFVEPKDIHYLVPLTAEDLKKIKFEKAPVVVKRRRRKQKKKKIEVKDEKQDVVVPIEKPIVEEPKETIADVGGSRIEKPKPYRKPSYAGKPGRLYQRIELLENSLDAIRQLVKKNEKDLANLQSLSGEQTAITLQETGTKINLEKAVKHVTISDETNRGKILTLAKEGFFETWHPLREVVQALEEHKWAVNRGSIQTELINMANDGLLGLRKKRRENYYALSPNIIFVN